jgi:hypothetical protein
VQTAAAALASPLAEARLERRSASSPSCAALHFADHLRSPGVPFSRGALEEAQRLVEVLRHAAAFDVAAGEVGARWAGPAPRRAGTTSRPRRTTAPRPCRGRTSRRIALQDILARLRAGTTVRTLHGHCSYTCWSIPCRASCSSTRRMIAGHLRVGAGPGRWRKCRASPACRRSPRRPRPPLPSEQPLRAAPPWSRPPARRPRRWPAPP